MFRKIFGQSDNKEQPKSENKSTEYSPEEAAQNSPPKKRSSKEVVGQDPYQEFVKGKNTYMNNLGRDFYDNVSDAKKEPTVWEQIVKSDKAAHPDKVEE